jgi:small subunit ribosomal protein S12e
VLRKSLAYGGLACGLHEGAKVIEKHVGQHCVLAEDCDQPDYVKLVKVVCAEHNVSLLTVPSGVTHGSRIWRPSLSSERMLRFVKCRLYVTLGERVDVE